MILNVGWPDGAPASTRSVGDVPAHSTASVTRNIGAWYVDPYSTVLAPTTYQSKSGPTYTINVPITYDRAV